MLVQSVIWKNWNRFIGTIIVFSTELCYNYCKYLDSELPVKLTGGENGWNSRLMAK